MTDTKAQPDLHPGNTPSPHPIPSPRPSIFLRTSISEETPRLPRVLFTGFSVFPGAPLNPTEHLLPLLSASYDAGQYTDLCSSFSTAIFPVEYATISDNLSSLIDRDPIPDIVVHFGLHGSAKAITLETVARNRCAGHPDNIGHCRSGSIVDGGDIVDNREEVIPSRLPLNDIHAELSRRGIPVEWSDDAGGYLCNYIFYLSASTSTKKPCPEWMPGMVGFVHVPKLAQETWYGGKVGMEMEVLKDAAEAILEVCCREWMVGRDKSVEAEKDRPSGTVDQL